MGQDVDFGHRTQDMRKRQVVSMRKHRRWTSPYQLLFLKKNLKMKKRWRTD